MSVAASCSPKSYSASLRRLIGRQGAGLDRGRLLAQVGGQLPVRALPSQRSAAMVRRHGYDVVPAPGLPVLGDRAAVVPDLKPAGLASHPGLPAAIRVSVRTITNWERRHTEPEPRRLPAIIRFLGYNPTAQRMGRGGSWRHPALPR